MIEIVVILNTKALGDNIDEESCNRVIGTSKLIHLVGQPSVDPCHCSKCNGCDCNVGQWVVRSRGHRWGGKSIFCGKSWAVLSATAVGLGIH